MTRIVVRFLAKFILYFIAITLVLVIAFKWIPVPYTATMAMDENPTTKDWEPLELSLIHI